MSLAKAKICEVVGSKKRTCAEGYSELQVSVAPHQRFLPHIYTGGPITIAVRNAIAFQVSTPEVTRCLAGSKLPFVVVVQVSTPRRRCQVQVSGVRCRQPGVRCQVQVSDAGVWVSGVRCQVSGVISLSQDYYI